MICTRSAASPEGRRQVDADGRRGPERRAGVLSRRVGAGRPSRDPPKSLGAAAAGRGRRCRYSVADAMPAIVSTVAVPTWHAAVSCCVPARQRRIGVQVRRACRAPARATTVLGVSPRRRTSASAADVAELLPAWVLDGVTVSVSAAASADAGSAASAAAAATSPTRARLGRNDTWQIPPLDDVLLAGGLHPRLPPRRPIHSRRGADAEVARRAMLAACLGSCAHVATR